MAINFGAIGEQYVTFKAGTGLAEGEVCKVSANGTVSACEEDDVFAGVADEIRGDKVGVILGGYVEVPCSGTLPDPGYVILAADGDGGVYEADEGRTCLVVNVDSTNDIIGLFL